MYFRFHIWLIAIICSCYGRSLAAAPETDTTIPVDFYAGSVTLEIPRNMKVAYTDVPSQESIQHFYDQLNASDYLPLVNALKDFKEKRSLNDWFYYQLIRKTANTICPKKENYNRYTLYKWFLLAKSGYDARLAINNDRLIFFVSCDENIYNIPYFMQDGRQYVCLNIHDYAQINIDPKAYYPIDVTIPEGQKTFSYQVTQMPEFTREEYAEKDLKFNYRNKQYHFKILLNKEVPNIFVNYPVVDYASYFNIPLSEKTYSSLIPALKKNIAGMKQRKGIDYLMRFTRNAFLYEKDEVIFGKDKRMSPEQTLMNEYSDCDDRAALFFYLVKEIYNLPMIVLLYPTHVTIAVSLDKPTGRTISYKGKQYSVCEPTPQEQDLKVGQIAPEFSKASFEVAYEYNPGR